MPDFGQVAVERHSSTGVQNTAHVQMYLRTPPSTGHLFKFSSRALMATITVLADISTAPRAGVSSTPHA